MRKKKIIFATRLNVTHKKNKFIICTSDIYSRDLLLLVEFIVYKQRQANERVPDVVFDSSKTATHSSRFLSYLLPQFEGTTLGLLKKQYEFTCTLGHS